MTALSRASGNGDVAEVKRLVLLVGSGAIDTKDKYGKTPLALASEHDHLDVVKALLEAGADKESKDERGSRRRRRKDCRPR